MDKVKKLLSKAYIDKAEMQLWLEENDNHSNALLSPCHNIAIWLLAAAPTKRIASFLITMATESVIF